MTSPGAWGLVGVLGGGLSGSRTVEKFLAAGEYFIGLFGAEGSRFWKISRNVNSTRGTAQHRQANLRACAGPCLSVEGPSEENRCAGNGRDLYDGFYAVDFSVFLFRTADRKNL